MSNLTITISEDAAEELKETGEVTHPCIGKDDVTSVTVKTP